MSLSIGLYPKLDLWTSNKLHNFTVVTGRVFTTLDWGGGNELR
jgi:hypothetical protein